MREFFRGWKRKAGCVTLMLACVFTGAWVRSYHTIDLVFLNCLCPGTTFVTGGGVFQIVVGKMVSTLDKYDSAARNVEERNFIFERWEGDERRRVRRFRPSRLGWPITKFDVRISSATEETVVKMFPYWSIVLPLTLLSAWLLLSKPRAKNIQPTQVAPQTES